MKLVMAKEGYRKVGDKWLIAKKCTKCGEWKVASTENFHRGKRYKYGLSSQCKVCRSKDSKQYRKSNRDKILEYQRQYYEDNKEKVLERHRQYHKVNREKRLEQAKKYRETNKEKIAEKNKLWYEANREKIAEYHKQWHEANREKIVERQKQYRQDNKEKEAERKRQYYEANKEKICEYSKQWYEANKDKITERNKQYYQSPKGQVVLFNRNQRRRTKEEQQGDGITKDQWLEMMSFFDFRCAYSGERLTNNARSVDHIVPLNSGGDNAIWNCVPMLRSLNSSKKDKNMDDWYKEQSFYSEARLAKIYEWQEFAYNKWGKDTQYFNTNDIQIKLI